MTKESTSSANLPFLRHVSLYSRIIITLSLLLSILEFVRQCLQSRSVNFKNRIGICHFTFFFLPLISLALTVLAATRKNSGLSGAATVKAALRRMWARPSSWTRTAGSTSVRELDKSTNSPWSRRYLSVVKSRFVWLCALPLDCHYSEIFYLKKILQSLLYPLYF